MTDRGILFSASMVRALLAGTKTQTRRLAKPRKGLMLGELIAHGESQRVGLAIEHRVTRDMLAPPIHAIGDQLWVKEGFFGGHLGCPNVAYRADQIHPMVAIAWKSPIFMPRKSSRITLTVTEVRVQRLQEISEDDARAEGIEPEGDGWRSYETIDAGPHKGQRHPHAIVPNLSPITSYRELWNTLRTAEGERWEDDPFVVAYSFAVRLGNIDQVPA